jgi:tetratricopeptide (TPR) repeat protein
VGLKEEALRRLKKVEELSEDNPSALQVRKAIVYAGLGEKDEAFVCLEKAFQHRSPQLFNLQYLPGFDPLRSDPRYQDLRRRMNFPD